MKIKGGHYPTPSLQDAFLRQNFQGKTALKRYLFKI